MYARAPLLLVVCLLVGLSAGCDNRPKTMPVVDARNMGAYRAWRSYSALDFPKEPWRELDAVFQEFRFEAMRRGRQSEKGIEGEMCSMVNGLTFQAMMRRGYELKVVRLEQTRAELKSFIDLNARGVAKEGVNGLVEELKRREEDQVKRLKAVIAEMVHARNRITELGGHVPPVPPEQLSAEPATMSRQDALRDVRTFIEMHRMGGIRAYGAWPAEFDTDGSWISGRDRETFLKLQASAKDFGHSVIAVRLYGVWRIYDGLIELPHFSKYVTGNLTEQDLSEIKYSWSLVVAETWARKLTKTEIESGALKPEEANTRVSSMSKPSVMPPPKLDLNIDTPPLRFKTEEPDELPVLVKPTK